MQDKEVGELWRYLLSYPGTFMCNSWRNIIRKLVEERKEHKKTSHDAYEGREGVGLYCEECSYTDGDWKDKALRDFGIDPEEWPKK